jgi:hypothetical protein
MKAGIASSDATDYSRKFVEQRLDSSILADIDRDALRAMQITEGDIIRIRKAANLPTMTSSARAKASENEIKASKRNLELLGAKTGSTVASNATAQIAADELYARELQKQELANTAISTGKDKGVISSNVIFEAGNLLQAANQQPIGGKFSSTGGSSSSQFSQPPSTQQVNNSDSLGLRGGLSSSNDPWRDTSVDMKALRQQEETQKTLETARMAIQKANEQARQASILEEQARLARLKQQQNDFALQQAQETARQALLIQQQAAQKLLSAQMEAAKPQFANQLSMPNQMNNSQASFPQAQYVARPLSQPLIPTPTGVSNSFIPTGPAKSNNQGYNNMSQTMVTSNGVQKPNWNNASINDSNIST